MIQYTYLTLKYHLTNNNLRAIILMLLCFSNFSFIQASGFDGDTLVTTSSGRLKAIKDLRVGDDVICYNSNLEQETNTIKGVCAFIVEATMTITTKDNISMVTGLMERFYLPAENQWVCAKDLKESDCLLNENLDYVAITNVTKNQNKDVMFIIYVDNQHNFLASQGKYIVHNGAIGAAVGVIAGASAVQGVYWGFTGFLGTISGPAAPVVVGVWCFWTAAPLAFATKVGALTGGITLATLTGPV
ncbi:MAG: Hint domain-containing protein [Candidatus Dependentiae bacterium]|nr:Hint domain-containing protein [Candidatus Dependentiae bacterium]